ncbi:protein ALTERED PHOSPHATE STARVATION RESPONSE 1 [Cornus florida]|uniref:protein ALTERED PHOSPHATE STARVATION RESPONSE 1 n=1 Tax=Cornus florida TaxID=4283 RepID=UPI00289B1BCF|nr:protein ALTERED PHOSPHATE STARVATION RESPONSE 1 [Cornus florida]XP_059665064.1 protein ALTERED PHOSPHATE STARVATION RESPONSE 1 [Cornus florida]
MGASNSKIEEDKALRLCRERKKFVKQALNGRCSLAVTHVTYIQSLKITGTALGRFVEPEPAIESSLYTSTSATPEPLAVTEKSLSQFSLSSPSMSQRVDATENLSPSPSPPTSVRYHANHMKFRGTFSRKVEEKPSVPVMGSITSSSTPHNTTPQSNERPETSPFEDLAIPPTTPPWDYFGLFNPIDDHFSSQEGSGMDQGFENGNDVRRVREEEGIPDLEDEEDMVSSPLGKASPESEDEFDEPPADTLVRSFENVNRAPDHVASGSFAMPSAKCAVLETEFVNGEKRNSPDLSPLRATSLEVALPTDVKRTPVKEDDFENKVAPKDIFSSIKYIEFLFIKASDSGIEVPRMLEANKFHFRPIFPGKERGSMASALLKTCFSCGEDPSQVQEEPAQTTVKYLTWHRTTSSHSSSSRNPLCPNSKDEIEDLTSNLFDNFCMTSGSHASTLDRLYAWERKLYDEVKASEMVRKEYDMKCRLLRQLESQGESSQKIDKTRAMVKDLHSRIRVAIHRIDSISKKIEELRDKELQPQLEELIEGLRRMWVVMFECHKLQFHTISIAYNSGNAKISIQSESHRQITTHLEHELNSLSTSFTKWIDAQKSYVQAINGWLLKCVTLQQKSSRRKRNQTPSLRHFGPPIYVTCGVWLDLLNTLPTKPVTESIKVLASEITRFLPHHEKNQGKGMNHTRSKSWQAGGNSDPVVNVLRDEASEDWITGFDRFRSSLVGFLGHLSNYAESSVLMFNELQKKIQEAKSSHERS